MLPTMSNSSAEVSSKKSLVTLTLFGLLVVAGLLLMPVLAGAPDGDKMPDVVRFFGRFHPVILHLPIGMLTLVMVMEFGRIIFRKASSSTTMPMFFAAASAVVAVIFGFLLYQGGGYEGSALAERHLWGGIIFACLVIASFLVKIWADAFTITPWAFRGMLLLTCGIMGAASHDGASITHGEGYLTDYAPDSIRKALGMKPKGGGGETKAAKPLDEQVVYTDIVAPIFEQKCYQCHNAEKMKGKLRMDTYELLVKGGKEGPAIEPGNPAKSNVVVRIEMPVEEEKHMAPKGKPQIDKNELAVIKWWLQTGASQDATFASLKPTEEVKTAIASMVPAVDLEAQAKVSEKAKQDASKKRDELKGVLDKVQKEFPGAVQFESRDSSALTFTAVSMRAKFGDAQLKQLQSVLPHLISADLSATEITDQSAGLLAGASSIKSLRLAETKVTDASIESLKKLHSLESLNLYGTAVTDAGILKLSELSNLKSLYLWQTKVTPAGIEALQKKLPKCKIIQGV